MGLLWFRHLNFINDTNQVEVHILRKKNIQISNKC